MPNLEQILQPKSTSDENAENDLLGPDGMESNLPVAGFGEITSAIEINTVVQSGASAGGDVIGRDKYKLHQPTFNVQNYPVAARGSPIEILLRKLQQEIATNEHVRIKIDELIESKRN